VVKKGKINISDVARTAGLSTTTVSRVINNVSTVSSSNRYRVEEAIKKLNYKPNVSAQYLAGKKSMTVGLVIQRYAQMFQTFHMSEIIHGVADGLSEFNMDLLLHVTPPEMDDRLVNTHILNLTFVRGLLFSDKVGNEEMIKKARAEGIDYVIMIHHDKSENCVSINNHTAAIDAINYLSGLGHKRIATITGKPYTQAGGERLEGYKEAMRDHGLKIESGYIVEGDWSSKSGADGMEKLFKCSQRPTAVFVAGDEMAIEAIRVIQEAGLKVPGDISIVGFDDIPLAAYIPTPLTTVRQPMAEMAKRSAFMLNRIVSGEVEGAVQEKLSAELVKRKSTAPPKKGS